MHEVRNTGTMNNRNHHDLRVIWNFFVNDKKSSFSSEQHPTVIRIGITKNIWSCSCFGEPDSISNINLCDEDDGCHTLYHIIRCIGTSQQILVFIHSQTEGCIVSAHYVSPEQVHTWDWCFKCTCELIVSPPLFIATVSKSKVALSFTVVGCLLALTSKYIEGMDESEK